MSDMDTPEGEMPPWLRVIWMMGRIKQLEKSEGLAWRLLDEFDRYASVPSDTGYVNSPFGAQVRSALAAHAEDKA